MLPFLMTETCLLRTFKMSERGSLNDVKITLSDGEIVANKDILMARSEYFSTMFSNDKFIEGDQLICAITARQSWRKLSR